MISKTQLLKIAATLAALAVMAACSSFPPPASDKDSILIIPLKVSIETSAPGFGHFEMSIYPVGSGVPQTFGLALSGAFSMVKGLNEGAYTLSSIVFKYDAGQTGSPYAVNAPVSLEGGSITIFPMAFGYRLYKDGNRLVMAAGWTQLTQEIADKLAKQLATDKNVKAWRFSKSTLQNPYLRQALQNAGLE